MAKNDLNKSGEIEKDKLVSLTCQAFGVSKTAIMGRRRTQKVAEARHACWYSMHKKDAKSFTKARIGRAFNRKGPTVIHGIKNIEDLMSVDEEVREKINKITE